MKRLCALFLAAAVPAQAQDFVESDGPLSDADFYRLVACAAPLGGECTKPFYQWEKTQITVGIVERARPFLGGKMKRADAALVRALQRLEGVEMGLTLSRDDTDPDIAIHLLDTPRGEKIATDFGSLLNGLTMANAIATLDVDGAKINAAAIGFSRTMTIRQYESVMLEELTQALGLITDIKNPYYRTRSIFSQTADNSLKTLGEQDKIALIRHYPPQ